jgi:hypothetical protein
MKFSNSAYVLALSLFVMVPSLRAEGDDASDLAKQTQNPVANLISIPFQDNIGFIYGPDHKTQNVLNIQPVIPISLTPDWNMITRTILPVISNPWPQPAQGIGDILATAFFSPVGSKKFIWGAGPALSMPSGSETALTSGQWAAGPSVVALTMQKEWVVGALVNNVWSFAGHDDRAATSAMTLQPFINYNLPKGAYLTTGPIMTANWKATQSSNRWTVPAGAGIGKLWFVGKLPVNTTVQYYNNIIRPDYGPLWTLRAQVQILLPKWLFTGKKPE